MPLREPSYKPLAVANEFIVRSESAGVDHMKLQKLVYLSYGWWLAYYDDPFISERPQVWKHGPVFNSLYHALSQFGWRSINHVQNDNFSTEAPRIRDDDEQVLGLIDWIWQRYGQRSSTYLSEMTHKPGTPWDITVRRCGRKVESGYRIPRNTFITDDVIKDHYHQLAVKFGFAEDEQDAQAAAG